MPHWEIEPSHDSDYDHSVMPGETEADHDAAFTYAVERLEEMFDQSEPGDIRTLTIRFRKGDMPNFEAEETED